MGSTASYDYGLPDGSIAQTAIEPRDAARLLVVRTMSDMTVRDLPKLMAPGDLVVVNRTRVRAARLHGRKVSTGGAVEVLLLGRDGDGVWQALCRPARRLRQGTVLEFGDLRAEVRRGPADGVVGLVFETGDRDLEELLPARGEVPLPPYFHGSLADPERYQTVFAERVGSAAAPTAGLHFTRSLLDEMDAAGMEVAAIDLEVGLDTFRPISASDVADHEMHSERFSVPSETVHAFSRARQRRGRVVAVGTTVVRALESAWRDGAGLIAGDGETRLFIAPGYRFRAVDAVLTNFHAPRTTLAVMAAALIGPEWRSVYQTALDRGYRFLSFGDAMLIDPVAGR